LPSQGTKTHVLLRYRAENSSNIACFQQGVERASLVVLGSKLLFRRLWPIEPM